MELLDSFVGQQLISVTFIHDYIQLSFDTAQVTAITNPAIFIAGEVIHFGDPGYRDRLCDQIGIAIRQATVIEGDRFSLAFDNNVQIVVSLKSEDYQTVEAVTVKFDDNRWVVW